ncbi:response regulator [Massilia atriviolacea]|uniref:response regulator n=1 Tax=Massilia atriviolacea TaxID=2495579 RepID=UPI001E47E4B2|nr:response regulator [Massilia atriviolacea]
MGFPSSEGAELGTALAHPPRDGPSYSCLLGDSLQEPDLTIANGDDLGALAALLAWQPDATRPALVIGSAGMQFPCAHITRPLDMFQMFKLLSEMARKRAEALNDLPPPAPPHDRRRRIRLDLDITDPAEFVKMRRPQARGAVLIVDKRGALRDHVARLLAAHHVAVEWTESAAAAVRLCAETPVAVVMINTSTPGVDPYALCAEIKQQEGAERIAVVLLVNQASGYDTARARAAGVRGLLDKPMADRHLVAALKKLLSLPQ